MDMEAVFQPRYLTNEGLQDPPLMVRDITDETMPLFRAYDGDPTIDNRRKLIAAVKHQRQTEYVEHGFSIY